MFDKAIEEIPQTRAGHLEPVTRQINSPVIMVILDIEKQYWQISPILIKRMPNFKVEKESEFPMRFFGTLIGPLNSGVV